MDKFDFLDKLIVKQVKFVQKLRNFLIIIDNFNNYFDFKPLHPNIPL